MKTRTNNPDTPRTAQQLLDDCMAKLNRIGEEYEAAVATGTAEDYYLSHLERQMERLDTLAHLYMGIVSDSKGSRSA